MIDITIKLTGFFVDRPTYKYLTLEEDSLAMEKKNETTGKFETLTVGHLYNIFATKRTYEKSSIDPEEQPTEDLFENWFREKYLRKEPWENRILSIEYKKT